MNVLKLEDIQSMILAASDAVIRQEMYLCELDSFVGDGDHGVTVARGFKAVKSVLENTAYPSVSELLVCVSETLSETMGGAIGPIFGSIFEGAGEAAEGIESAGTKELASMLREGLENVMLIGGAKEGDRTLVDCLAPAVRTLEEMADRCVELPAALHAAVLEAEKGVLATTEMIAKKGRAKFLAEKSKGHQDAGATSMFIILTAMKDYCNADRKEE